MFFSGAANFLASGASVSRRILRIEHDSCYGWPGHFAVETFENIGTKNICDGLCNMNYGTCMAPIYIPGTKMCYLKVLCKIQLKSTEMIPIPDDGEDDY